MARRPASFVVWVLFCAPFCLGGVGAIGGAVRQWLSGGGGDAWFLFLFGLVFGGVGFGLLAAARVGARRAAELEENRRLDPDKPWRWRKDWREGRIVGQGKSTAIVALLFALVWNGVAWLPLFSRHSARFESEIPIRWVLLFFPLVGVALAIWAFRAWIRHLRFGKVLLVLEPTPATVGGGLSGRVEIPAALRGAERFELRLDCVRRRKSGTGKDRSVHEEIVWQETREVERNATRRSESGTVLPVAIPIAAGLPPTDVDPVREPVLWRLHVTAEVPGVDFATRFDVPVFLLAAGMDRPLGSMPIDEEEAEDRLPAGSRVRHEVAGDEETFRFPPFRNPGVVAGVGLFTAVWSALWIGLIRMDAGWPFALGFGLFEAVLVSMLFGMTCIGRSIRVGREGAFLRTSILGLLNFDRHEPRGSVRNVTVRNGMRAGGRIYYDLQLGLSGRRSRRIGTAIRDKKQARWIAARLRRSLGLAEPGPPRDATREPKARKGETVDKVPC